MDFRKALLQWQSLLPILLVATAVIVLSGWLIDIGLWPLQPEPDLSSADFTVISVFLVVAVVLGLVLPLAAWIAWFRDSQVRRLLGAYLLMMVIQIATEQILIEVFFISAVVITGTLYTALRLVQLWQGQRLILAAPRRPKHAKWLLRLVRVLLGFWVCNLLMLLIVCWPSMV